MRKPNKSFNKQYDNEICRITDGLTHADAIWILTLKESQKLIEHPTLIGYKDASVGYYDKYWRYNTKQEPQYLMGVQAAINNGASIEHYIGIAEHNLPLKEGF